ncbi:MAG: type IV pilus twitching motility protein PilT [Nitrospirae bacterium]|nr:type IV pilus twitching motility protein PilT [Nitrospirota bacterium]MBI5695469.1 type IV pilus twitching motility protein PilT [Nitrospirota bacterium]
MARIDEFFRMLKEQGASDLHLSSGCQPIFRLHGEMVRQDFPPFGHDELKALLFEILTEKQKEHFEEKHDLDFAYEVPGIARFRGNMLMQHRGIAAVFRIIPTRILSAQELGLPEGVLRMTKFNKGLVLVTGPTGSGKSTTLAAMIDLINSTRAEHILTLEDPLEFIHENKKALLNQRQVGEHTESFSSALRAALREDPDIILVGEMRDLETISLAMSAAETGHLVFGTLHTNTAAKTIDRIIDVFPKDAQSQVRMMLSESLKGVVCQQLIKKADGKGRVAALEIMLGTPAIGNLIREGKTVMITSIIQTAKKEGMQLLDQHLMDLLKTRQISPQDAYRYSVDKRQFEQYVQRTPAAPGGMPQPAHQ